MPYQAITHTSSFDL